MRQNPKGAAANILPTAAAANQSVFYNKSGEARSLQQIYQRFAQKFDSSLTSNASATKSSGASFAVASAGQISMDLARLMPLATAATTQRSSVADASFALRSQTKTGNMTLASAGMSTLFDAMIFGQIQGTGLHTTSPLSAFDEEADEKKKNAYSVLSAVA